MFFFTYNLVITFFFNIFVVLNNKIMSNYNLNGFPTDGSYGTQIKYDMFAKHMSSALSSVNSSKSSNLGILGLILSIFQLGLSIILIVLLLFAKFLDLIVGYFIKKNKEKRLLEEEAKRKEEIKKICSGI